MWDTLIHRLIVLVGASRERLFTFGSSFRIYVNLHHILYLTNMNSEVSIVSFQPFLINELQA